MREVESVPSLSGSSRPIARRRRAYTRLFMTPGPICGRPPACKSLAACGSDRLRSYVRPVDGGAHDRLPRWVPRRGFRTYGRCQAPQGPTECLASGIDRSHHLLRLKQAPASARGDSRSRAELVYAFAICVLCGGVARNRSEERCAEPPHSAARRSSRSTSGASLRPKLRAPL